MFKRRKMRFNGEWSLLAGNRVYELSKFLVCIKSMNWTPGIGRVCSSLLYFTLSGQFQSTLSEDKSEFGIRLQQNSLKTVLEQSKRFQKIFRPLNWRFLFKILGEDSVLLSLPILPVKTKFKKKWRDKLFILLLCSLTHKNDIN
jgi:hypothetical protein